MKRRKLTLKTETITTLQPGQLGQVGGGSNNGTYCVYTGSGGNASINNVSCGYPILNTPYIDPAQLSIIIHG
jgi:hypothetical protein